MAREDAAGGSHERHVERGEQDSVNELVRHARYTGPTVTADELVGLEACLSQLAGQLALIARPELALRFGLEASGSLFIGPPGTGKTMAAKYLAGHLDIPLYQVAADEFLGDPRLVHGLFRALSNERAVLFIDEVSLLAAKREWSAPNDRRMLSALLTALDGLTSAEARNRLWVIGACTPDIQLDPAIYRSGRLGVVIEFAPPSEEQRRDLYALYLRAVPHTVTEEQIARLAQSSPRATGADIHDWVSQAASEVLAEAASDEPVIEFRHLETVVARRGFVAAKRPGRAPTHETAIHEAAHVVLAIATFGVECLGNAKVGFAPDDKAMRSFERGHFAFSDDWLEAHRPTTADIELHAAVKLAGAVAEEQLLGYRGTGATHDVEGATRLLRSLLDMGEAHFGPSRSALEDGPSPYAVVGADTMRELAWLTVRARFAHASAQAGILVSRHAGAIEKLADTLLMSKAQLSGQEIVALVGDLRMSEVGRANDLK